MGQLASSMLVGVIYSRVLTKAICQANPATSRVLLLLLYPPVDLDLVTAAILPPPGSSDTVNC